jgi:hypothetical protein
MTADTAMQQGAKNSARPSRRPRERPRAAQNARDLKPMSVKKESRRRRGKRHAGGQGPSHKSGSAHRARIARQRTLWAEKALGGHFRDGLSMADASALR